MSGVVDLRQSLAQLGDNSGNRQPGEPVFNGQSDGNVPANFVPRWEVQHQLGYVCRRLRGLAFARGSAVSSKATAEHTGDVKQRPAATNQASVMRTISDAIALGAQDSVLQANCVERSELSTSVTIRR